MLKFKSWAVVGIAALSLVSCSTTPPAPSWADTVGKYEALKTKSPERVNFDFEADCTDMDTTDVKAGECIVSEQKIKDAEAIIDNLNTAYDLAIQSSNEKLSAISHCEYAGLQKDQALVAEEKRYSRLEIGSTVKNLLTGAACIGLLFSIP